MALHNPPLVNRARSELRAHCNRKGPIKCLLLQPRSIMIPLGNSYTDGPPQWIMSKGKPYERPCQTLAQANRQRIAAAKRLHWHGNRNGDMATINLEARLLAEENPVRPCLSGACPICMRAQQRLLVIASMHILPELARPDERPQAISLVPEFGRVRVGDLASFDYPKFRSETQAILKASGIKRFLLSLDASLNHEDGELDEAYWNRSGGGSLRSRADRGVSVARLSGNPSRTVSSTSLH